jgi:hypothetical protein
MINITQLLGDDQVAKQLYYDGKILITNNELPQEIIFVSERSHLPDSVAGEVTLPANGNLYFFLRMIDLEGDTFYPTNNSLIGSSQELAGLENASVAINETCTIKFFRFNNCSVTIDAPLGAFDWNGLNFYDCSSAISILNAQNCVFETFGFINSRSILLDGTIDSLVMTNSIVRDVGYDENFFVVSEFAVVNRRIRIENSVFATTLAGQKGILVQSGATIPDEGFVLKTVRFTGPGEAVSGINGNEDRAMFKDNVGNNVINTSVKGYFYMKNNALATTISVIGDRYEVLGTKTLDTFFAQRFVNNANRLEYTSSIPKKIFIQASYTHNSGANNIIGTYIAIARNGNPIDPDADRISESEMYVTTSGSRPDGGFCQCITEISQGDRIYIVTQNTSATNDVTYSFLNFIVKEA